MRGLSLLVAIVMMLGLVSCAPARGDVGNAEKAFSYASRPFTATLRITRTRSASDGYTGDLSLVGDPLTDRAVTLTATVSYAPPVSPAGAGDTTLTFTSPDSLAGMQVTRVPADPADGGQSQKKGQEGDVVTLTLKTPYGTICASGEAYTPLLRYADAILPHGDILGISPTQDGTYTVTRQSPSVGTITYTFTKDSDLPRIVEMVTNDETLRISVDEVQ